MASEDSPEDLAGDLERLGPTFVKLGQLLSTRADILAPHYLEALARLQDDVEPFAFADVQRIVEEELGVRLSKVVAELDYRREAAWRSSCFWQPPGVACGWPGPSSARMRSPAGGAAEASP